MYACIAEKIKEKKRHSPFCTYDSLTNQPIKHPTCPIPLSREGEKKDKGVSGGGGFQNRNGSFLLFRSMNAVHSTARYSNVRRERKRVIDYLTCGSTETGANWRRGWNGGDGIDGMMQELMGWMRLQI
jgi:hypothetical protein